MKFNSAQIREINKENLKWPEELTKVPVEQWPSRVFDNNEDTLIDVFRSRTYLVQVFYQSNRGKVLRLSVQRTDYDERKHRFKDNISWDDLQRLKREAGFGELCALEVYPPDDLVVNVANMRHLFLLPTGQIPNFVWK